MNNIVPQDVNPPLKQCSGPCSRFLPATPKYFNRDKSKKDGLRPRCIECRKEENLQNEEKRKEYRQSRKEEMKAYGERHRQENREYYRKFNKQYKQEHKEEIKEQRNRYNQAHKNEMIEYRKERHKKHKERLNKQSREYNHKNRDRLSEYNKQYIQTERGRAIRKANNHKRRATKKRVGGTYTVAQIEEKLKKQKHRCYYAACGHSKFKKHEGRYIYHVDHIVPLVRDNTSNSIDNLVLACPSCNFKKHDKLPHEWPEGGRLL